MKSYSLTLRKMERVMGNIEYEMVPQVLRMGDNWVKVRVKNVGGENLENVDIRLNSNDTLALHVYDNSRYIEILRPDEEAIFFFRVNALLNARMYISLDSFFDDEYYYWESLPVRFNVGDRMIEIIELDLNEKKRPIIKNKVEIFTTLFTTLPVESVVLQLWIENPQGDIEELKTIEIEDLDEEVTQEFRSTFVPEDKGPYIVHAYLYDEGRRIDYMSDLIYVTNE